MTYCWRCDLAFCPAHADEHPDSCKSAPAVEAAREVEQRYGTELFCCVCAGLLLPTAQT